jgi:enoyl-CoA hydratase/carnithine racemase
MALRTIDTGTTDLLAHIDDGVAVITMNRPERRNALSAAMDLEATHHIHCALTQDHREAAKAFVEKRTPQFVGR